jgi:acyl-[acyl-carrier-protein] desaturase
MPRDEETEARVAEQLEVLGELRPQVKEDLGLLLPVSDAWQPTDYLPDLTAPDWREQLEAFRGPAAELSDEVLVVVVGDMVTEEALPNYAVSLNTLARDEEGTSDDPWAIWLRGWTAEENRHGDLLNAFLRLTGRVDMRSIEVTIQNLIANGFNPRAYPDPYGGLIYTSFQERATKISHVNTGRLAEKDGDSTLGRICKRIAGDESRHEAFYTRVMGRVMDRDPERAILVFRQMLRRIIAMPGRLMHDGSDPDLFEHFAAVAQRLGVYTAFDYASIVRHLVSTWRLAERSVSGKAAAAQAYLCAQAERLESLADQITDAAARQPPIRFSWIHGRTA